MITVRMSPTSLARWSLRKAREPGRHSELGWRSIVCGAGIGRETACGAASGAGLWIRSEEHTSELQSLMRISYAVFCLKKKTEYTLVAALTPTITHSHAALT